MKYAIMICDYGDDEQIFLGIKKKEEVKRSSLSRFLLVSSNQS